MRLLIVDDEDYVLSGIKNLIEESGLDYEIRTSNNATLAFEIAKQFWPHIIITDIRMPGVDGLMFCENLKKLNYSPKIIIISGYENFEYAKKSLELNVDSYLLKPIDQEELLKTICDIQETIILEKKNDELNKKNTEEAKSKLLHDIISLKIDSPVLQEKIGHLRGIINIAQFTLVVYKVNTFLRPQSNSQSLKPVEDNNKNHKFEKTLLSQLMENSIEYIQMYNRFSELVFLIGAEAHVVFHILNTTARIISAESNFSEIIGISRTYIALEDISKAYEDALLSIKKGYSEEKYPIYIFSEGQGDSRDKEDLSLSHPREYTTFLDESKEALFGALSMYDYDRCGDIADNLFDHMSRYRYSIDLIHIILFEIINSLDKFIQDETEVIENSDISELLKSYGDFRSCWSVEELKNTFLDYIKKAITSFEALQKSQAKTVISKVKKAIQENYPNIDLQSAASDVGISPVYLSVLFKEKTGENFIDYVTKVRIEAAKNLLKDSKNKVFEISTYIGYTDSKYFSKIFKKVTGHTPKGYRDLYLKHLDNI